MPIQKYSDFLELNPAFESVVDLAADARNANLWREYIVGDDMVKLMECLCQSLNYESPDARRSIWMHGSYGTGKSYAAILIKHLMEEKPQVVDDYLQRNTRLSPFRNRFMNARGHGDYMVVWKTGVTGVRTGDQLLLEVEFAIRQRLREQFGDKAYYGGHSLRQAAWDQLNNRSINWEHVFEDSYLGDLYDSLDQVREAVEAGDLQATRAVADVIRQNGWGLINNVETFKEWIADIIPGNHLENSGIFFIWDEFTDYVRRGDDPVVMQQISEFCKEQPLFMCFVVHKAADWVDAIGNATYQQITHRFHEVEFHVSADAAYDLIAGSITVRNGMDQHWKEARRGPVRDIKPFMPDIVGLDDRISEKLEAFCPVHPMTIKLLSSVSENFAASQRTMFRFMKDTSDSQLGFLGYINRFGPQDQCCWLTPDWLWDYFFLRESDFTQKESKVPQYIRHYEESYPLAQADANAHRVFKVAMLLLAVMSTTSSFISTGRKAGAVAATLDCLENCLAGTLSKTQIKDYLRTFEDSRVLLTDTASNGVVRLQMPFKGLTQDDFQVRYNANDKKCTRYQMFGKEGKVGQALEKQAWDENDAMFKRMKIVSACAETNSLKQRIAEVQDALQKAPYKLGLVLVTVNSEAQYLAVQKDIETRAAQSGDNRLTFALLKNPFTDEMRKQWLTAITKSEMAAESGNTADSKRYEMEATTLVSKWVSPAVSAGKLVAWNGDQKFSNLFGMPQLRKVIETNVLDVLFPCAPEKIVVTNTAYKTCSQPAALAGVTRETKNSQMISVLNGLKQAQVMEIRDIHQLAKMEGGKATAAVARLAREIAQRMDVGKMKLGDLWQDLQRPPFGYYNCIACGVLLGFVFSCYKDSAYSWTDSAQGNFVLNEGNLATMVLKLCKNELTTDYLSMGSQIWQNFRPYLKSIVNLTDGQTANETEGMRSARERITEAGAPFWSLKWAGAEQFGGIESKDAAVMIVDNIQAFIVHEGDTDGAMSNVIQLFNGRGKLRQRMTKLFGDKSALASAFRTFLFEHSPELKEITEKLSVQPEDLRDKVFSAMQNAIYTWTEEQVVEKLPGIVSEYQYLDALNQAMRQQYHSPEAAIKDLRNAFSFMRVSIEAIQRLEKHWFGALAIMHRIVSRGIAHMTSEEREADIQVLTAHGADAWDCIMDARPVLSDILTNRDMECTQEELESIYKGLRDVSCTFTCAQFDKELNMQIGQITQSRNRLILTERWKSITGTESIRQWCNDHSAPLFWVLPKELSHAFQTLLEIQNGQRTLNTTVVDAINKLDNMDESLLNDDEKITKAFLDTVGQEYAEAFVAMREKIMARLKLQLGNDMTGWMPSDIAYVQRELMKFKQEKDRAEKGEKARHFTQTAAEDVLRQKLSAFLDKYPQYCDWFI